MCAVAEGKREKAGMTGLMSRQYSPKPQVTKLGRSRISSVPTRMKTTVLSKSMTIVKRSGVPRGL